MLQSPTWSPLEILITRACEPSLHEPNYASHLEVAEYINQKKANNPREAAMIIARFANHRNPHIAILALALLDTLIQSCGYPFHLQISTKEFLNELVRRFPERPPPFPGPVMSRILELIHTWKEGICTESRWKEDLGNIRDMHRLLTFKGYRFRDVPKVFVLQNLKSAEELEEEDRAAQSAKLQELIRRGTPRDLAAAQELMKALAGANPDAKPDYRSQSLTELNKLEQKVILLNEMLDNVDEERGEKFVKGDAYDQVSSILVTARPKIQKWVSDAETDDPESLDTFLQINDQINTVLTRYEAFKKGDYSFAANPIPHELSNNAASGSLSLIDFDESSPSNSKSEPVGNDLAGLFSSPPQQQQQPVQQPQFGMYPAFGGSMPPMMGTGMQQRPQGQQQQQQVQQVPQPTQPHAPIPLFHNGSGFNRPTTFSPPQPSQSATPPASIVLPGTPGPAPSQLPNYFSKVGATGKVPVTAGLSAMGGMDYRANIEEAMSWGQQPVLLGSQIPSSFPSYQGQQQQAPFGQQQQQQPVHLRQQPPVSGAGSTSNVASGQQGKDPFADLAGLF